MAFHTMFNTILFDFDGTLANTNGLVIESWQHVYRVLTGSEAEEEALKATFGEPLAVRMFDITCAHNAGVKAVLVGWAEAVTKADLDGPDAPEYFIEKAEDLLKLV